MLDLDLLQCSCRILISIPFRLGGKSPSLIFDDADMEVAVAKYVVQICSLSRTYADGP